MKRPILITLLLSLNLGIMVIVFRQDLIRELVLLPISYLVWIGGLIYRSIDQQVVWTSLIILVVIISWASLKLRRSILSPSRDQGARFSHRIERWSKRLTDVQRGTYMQWRLAQHLSNLAVETLAYRAGLTRTQMDERITQGDINLPDEIQAYLLAARGFEVSNSMSRRMLFSSVPQPLDLPPEKLAEFIESYLEVHSDHKHR